MRESIDPMATPGAGAASRWSAPAAGEPRAGRSARTHRADEFPAGYSSAGCSPAEPTSASPAASIMDQDPSAGDDSPANGNLSPFSLSHHRGSVHACERGSSFWGHFIVDNACLRALLPRSHPDLAAAGLQNFDAAVAVRPGPDAEVFQLSLQASPEALSRVARVDYYGFYEGYDENGNTLARDWHGMSKDRRPYGHLGSAETPPFRIQWDTSMLPSQQDMAVRAAITFKDAPQLIYETAARTGVATLPRRAAAVKLLPSSEKPTPFWSRAGRKRVAALVVDVDPARIERAELHTVVWDGGRGNVREYFTLNGRAFEVAGKGRHDVIYTRLDVPPALIRQGRNEIILLSDTDHHGIEILEPGPALVIRYRNEIHGRSGR